MLNSDYKKSSEELFTRIPEIRNEWFNFVDDKSLNEDHKERYQSFFDFCQENLDEECEKYMYNIKPGFFYFTDSTEFNAYADLQNKTYIIGLNRGVIDDLSNFFLSKNIFSLHNELVKFLDLDKKIWARKKVHLNYLMFQNFNQFLYYHELGHLIQFSNSDSNKKDEKYLISSNNFDFKSHIDEIDADLHGANSIVFHIDDFFNKLEIELQTNETLLNLLSCSVAAILSYFLFLVKDEDSLYIKDSDHPHPIIRVLYITTTMLGCLKKQKKQIDFDENDIIKESIKICEFLFVESPDTMPKHKKILEENLTEILEYIEEMFSEMQKYPYLVSNTVHKRML